MVHFSSSSLFLISDLGQTKAHSHQIIQCRWSLSRLSLHCWCQAIKKNISQLTLQWTEIFILNQILCFFLPLCQNGHYLFFFSQMKACTIRKTNIRSEFSAQWSFKRKTTVFCRRLRWQLALRGDPQITWQSFSKENLYPAACKDMQALSVPCSGEVNLLWALLTMAVCLTCTHLFPKCCRASGWLVFEVQYTFSLKCYALSLSAPPCLGNICLKVNLRP